MQEAIAASRTNIAFLESCTPGYYNNEGQPNLELSRRNGAYSPGIIAFTRELEQWRAKPDLPGLVFSNG